MGARAAVFPLVYFWEKYALRGCEKRALEIIFAFGSCFSVHLSSSSLVSWKNLRAERRVASNTCQICPTRAESAMLGLAISGGEVAASRNCRAPEGSSAECREKSLTKEPKLR
jgi:hypothetical protein